MSWECAVGKRFAKTMFGAICGAIVVGGLSYGFMYTTTRPQGMGGGMAGWGHGLDSFLAGAGGALVGLIGGGFVAGGWTDVTLADDGPCQACA